MSRASVVAAAEALFVLPPRRESEGCTLIPNTLERDGWAHLTGVDPDGLAAAIAELHATVLMTTDVVVKEGRALVTSDRALGFHTDHHRADVIAWHCVRQTSEGGATLLADGVAAWFSLSEDQRAHLAKVRLFEHRVFPDDLESHPLIDVSGERLRLYYSFWLVDRDLDAATREAFDAFELAIQAHRLAALRLAPGDVLLVDNHRILHGRTAITGSRDRHLHRSWLALPQAARQ